MAYGHSFLSYLSLQRTCSSSWQLRRYVLLFTLPGTNKKMERFSYSYITPYLRADLKVFKNCLVLWAKNEYLFSPLDQLKTSCTQRLHMISCGHWPQLPKLSLFTKDLYVIAAVKEIHIIYKWSHIEQVIFCWPFGPARIIHILNVVTIYMTNMVYHRTAFS